MIDNDDGVPIRPQIIHHTGQTLEIIRMQADGRFVENIEDTCRAVADCPCELYSLPLTGGKRRGRPVKRQISKPQIHQPLRNIHEGFADIFRHGTHLFRQRSRNTLYPGDQLRKRHSRRLIQPDSPKPRRTGGFRQSCSMAVRADILFQIFFEPFHSLLILYLGKGIFHGIDRTVIIEIHLRRFQRVRIDIVDVMFLQLAVVDNLLLLRRQITKWDICPHSHRAHDILHQ